MQPSRLAAIKSRIVVRVVVGNSRRWFSIEGTRGPMLGSAYMDVTTTCAALSAVASLIVATVELIRLARDSKKVPIVATCGQLRSQQ